MRNYFVKPNNNNKIIKENKFKNYNKVNNRPFSSEKDI